MLTGTMTSKGQITLPKEVRDALRLTPGAKVTFTRTADGDFVISSSRPTLKSLAGSLAYAGPVVSLGDMDRAIADGASGS